MGLLDLLKQFDQIKSIQGVEKDLRTRQFKSNLSLGIGIFVAVLQFLIAFITSIIQSDETGKAADWFNSYIRNWPQNFLSIEYWGLYVVLAALLIYFLLSHTKFLLKTAEEPFHFTFWIEPFKYIDNKDGERFVNENHNQLQKELHHDLMTKLAERIKRLSLLNLDEKKQNEDNPNLGSHIQISGNFYFREEGAFTAVHVLPKVRIGNDLQAETLTTPVVFELSPFPEGKESVDIGVTTDDYSKILERVYSRVATEIYNQIRKDLDNKMALLPTRYTKAIAYFNEAEDFARSNTIDAYDIAIDLYQRSLDYFKQSYQTFLAKILINLPTPEWGIKLIHTWARANIGYAKCLIYRRQISALSGRSKNPLFEIPEHLEGVIRKLIGINTKISFSKWKSNEYMLKSDKNGFDSGLFELNDFRDVDHLILRFQLASRGNKIDKDNNLGSSYNIIDRIVTSHFTDEEQKLFSERKEPSELHQDCLKSLNRILNTKDFEHQFFKQNPILVDKLNMLKAQQGNKSNVLGLFRKKDKKPGEIKRLMNRIKLEYCYPDHIGNYQENKLREYRQKTTMDYLTFDDEHQKGLFKTDKILYKKHIQIVFDAHVVLALTFNYLDVPHVAEKYLSDAQAIAPNLSENDALYLVAAGEIEPELDKRVPYLVKATEIAPDFEIAHYLLATCFEMIFRDKDDLTPERANIVIEQYDRVLQLNPGNIASLVSQGNVFWLVKEQDKARKKFNEGIDMKAIVQQTFIGELLYGLARVKAEMGDYNKSFDHYSKAISTDPGVATYATVLSSRKITMSYFDYIGKNMLERYESLLNIIEEKLEAKSCLVDKELIDVELLIQHLRNYKDASANLIYQYLGEDLQQLIERYQRLKFFKEKIHKKLIKRFNELINHEENAIFFQDILNTLAKNSGSYKKYHSLKFSNKKEKKELLTSIFPGCFNTILIDQIIHQQLPEVVKRTIKAMVLNEYGNACLNYYLRFGYAETRQLETAVECYELATKLMGDENKVILYNLLYAYSLNDKNTNYEEQSKILNKTLKAASSWHTGNMSLVQLGIKLFKDLENELIVNINKEKENIDSSKKELHTLRSSLIGVSDVSTSYSENIGSLEKRSFREEDDTKTQTSINVKMAEGTKFTPQLRTERNRLNEIEKKIQESNKNIEKFEEKIKRIPSEKEEFINRQVSEIIGKTKLFSLYVGLQHDDSGDLIVKLVKKIKKNRLDDTDLEALSVWAEGLANKELNIKAQQNAEWLCEWIRKEYYLGSFSLLQILRFLQLQKFLRRLNQIYLPDEETKEYLIENLHFDLESQVHLLNLDHINKELNKHNTNYLLKYPGYFSYEKLSLFNTENDIANILFDQKNRLKFFAFIDYYYESGIQKLQKENFPGIDKLYYGAGLNFYDNKEYKKAINFFNKALTFEPNCSHYFYVLGKAKYRKVLSKNAKNVTIQLIEESRRCMDRAIQIEQTASEYYYELGQTYLENKDYDLAEILFIEAIDLLRRRDYKYLNTLGNVYYKIERFSKALNCYEEAIKLNPTYATYFSNKGLAFEKLKNYLEAESAHKEALRIEPRDPLILNDVGNVLFFRKKFNDALPYFKKAYEIDEQKSNEISTFYAVNFIQTLEKAGEKNKGKKEFNSLIDKITENRKIKNGSNAKAMLLNSFGNSFYHIKDDEKASKCYELAAEFDPSSSIYWSNLCLAKTAIKDYKKAEQAINKAISISPEEARLYDLKGTIYISEGNNFEKAKTCYITATNLEPENPNYKVKLVAIYDLLLLGGLADRAYLDAPKVKADDPEYLNLLGLKYYDLKYYAEAKNSFEKAVEIDAYNPTYHFNLGLALKQLKQNDLAEEAFQNAIKLKPYDGYYHNELGNHLYNQKKYEEALPHYYKAIEFEPKLAVFYSNVALMYQNLAKEKLSAEKDADEGSSDKKNLIKRKNVLVGKALDYYQQACELEPENADYFDRCAILCNDFEYHHKAIGFSITSTELDPENDLYFSELGFAYRKMSRWQESAIAYEKAFALKHDSATYINSAGYARYYGQEFPEAIENYKKAIKLDPKNAIYNENLALAYKDSGMDEKAIATYQKTLSLDLEDPYRIHQVLGQIYTIKNQFDLAIENFDQAIKLSPPDDPKKYQYWIDIGDIYLKMGNVSEAEYSYLQSVALKPKISDTYQKLGKLYIDQEKYTDAEKYLSNAVKLNNKSAEAAFLYGKILFLTGRYSDAKYQLTNAVMYDPDSSEYYTLLALNYIYLNQIADAHSFLKTALNLDPENSEATLYLGKTFRLMDNLPKAKAAYERAQKIGANRPEFDIELVKELLSAGEHKKADEVFIETLADFKENAGFLVNMGIELNDIDKKMAETCMKMALDLEFDNITGLHKLGKFYFDKSNQKKAVPIFEKILHHQPDDVNAIGYQVLSLGSINELEKAENVFKTGLKALKQDSMSINTLGNLFFSHAHFKNAAICYKLAAQINPDETVFHVNLILAFVKSGKISEADLAFREALTNHPVDAAYLAGFGDELFRQKLDEFAAACYQKAMQLDPTNASYAGWLYYILILLKSDQEAENLLQDLLGNPELSDIYWSDLAKFFINLKYTQLAIICYEKAVKLAQDPVIYLTTLATLYEQSNSFAEAADCYLQIIENTEDPQYKALFENVVDRISDISVKEKFIKRFEKLSNNDDAKA